MKTFCPIAALEENSFEGGRLGAEDLFNSNPDKGELSAEQLIVTDWPSLILETKDSLTLVGGTVEKKAYQKDPSFVEKAFVQGYNKFQ